MALEAIIQLPQAHRIILEEYPEGVYVLIFKAGEQWPWQDHLQDDWAMAKLHALEDFGVTDGMWRQISDTGIMG